MLVVPAGVDDGVVNHAAHFRVHARVPTLCYHHEPSKACLCRSSQPRPGWLGKVNESDQELIQAFADCAAKKTLRIVDCRGAGSALSMRLRRQGTELPADYPATERSFLGLPDMHAVRKSQELLFACCFSVRDEEHLHSSRAKTGMLKRSGWLQMVGALIAAAGQVCVGAALPSLEFG